MFAKVSTRAVCCSGAFVKRVAGLADRQNLCTSSSTCTACVSRKPHVICLCRCWVVFSAWSCTRLTMWSRSLLDIRDWGVKNEPLGWILALSFVIVVLGLNKGSSQLILTCTSSALASLLLWEVCLMLQPWGIWNDLDGKYHSRIQQYKEHSVCSSGDQWQVLKVMRKNEHWAKEIRNLCTKINVPKMVVCYQPPTLLRTFTSIDEVIHFFV